MNKKKLIFIPIIYLLVIGVLTGCGSDNTHATPGTASQSGIGTDSGNQPAPDKSGANNSNSGTGSDSIEGNTADSSQYNTSYRDSTPVCLVPAADGTAKTGNEVATIDYSHASDGYICAIYTGSVQKIKLRIASPDGTLYTYDLHGGAYETFPLSCGSGDYEVTIYENISGTNYSTCLYEKVSATITNEFSPFLYPNQYVNFTADSQVVAKGAELASTAVTDLDVITNIYDYITSNITYDYDKASDPPTGYTTDVDAILNSGTGICLDYAAVMTSMLRSQRIPTRLEVGYAHDAYHAWISVYTAETGWLNGIIEFDGDVWTLVDPTFGANTNDKTLKKFIGDGSNYVLQKMY